MLVRKKRFVPLAYLREGIEVPAEGESFVPLRRDMTVRLPDVLRTALDTEISEAKLVSSSSGTRTAEAVRVLLTAAVLRDHPAEVQVAAALLVNAHMLLSGETGKVVHGLRDAIRDSAARLTEANAKLLAQLTEEPVHEERKREKPPDRSRVHLKIDGWLYDSLFVLLQRMKMTDDAAEGIRRILVSELDQQTGVLLEYGEHAGRLRKLMLGIVEWARGVMSGKIEKIRKPKKTPVVT